MKEIWMPRSGYMVSNLGRVIGKDGETVLKLFKNKQGYLTYCHRSGSGKRRTVLVHRAVAECFLFNTGKPEVNHKNGRKDDNRLENLEWATRVENARHSYRTGLQKQKLDSLSAQIIRDAYKTKLFTQKQIAQYFNVDRSVISDIVNFKIHNHGRV